MSTLGTVTALFAVDQVAQLRANQASADAPHSNGVSMSDVFYRVALTALLFAGCVEGVLPRDPEPRSQAIGTVHVSTPLFTPLDPFREDRALDFKSLKDERYLSDRVNQANMSVSTLRSHEAAVGAAVRRVAEKEAGDASAAATAAGADPSTPGGDSASAVASLLDSPRAKHLLAPDEVATIVAALKLYMVSLEDYYNAVAIYNDALRSNPSWVPYRVHFTVTIDPGWFTQLNAYDALVDIGIGNPDEVQVLTVIPPQNAQAFEQFSATFRSLATALSGEGAINKFAARATVRTLRTAAERLEGLRANTTFTASAFDGNKMRLQFRPSLVPGKGQLELQPLSRIVTAVVLVKPAAGTTDGADQPRCPGEDSKGRQEGGDADRRWFARGIRAVSSEKCLSGGQIEVTHSAWFEAGATFRAGTRRPPHVPPHQRTICDSSLDPGSCRLEATTSTGYLPRWTPTAVFGAVELVIHDGTFWPAARPDIMHAAVSFALRVPAPEEGFRINIQGPGVVRCAQEWEELAESDPGACSGGCAPSSRASFVVYNPRASTFVCILDRQLLGDATDVPIYVTASSNSVALRGGGVDYSSVVTKSVLHRAVLAKPPAEGSSQGSTGGATPPDAASAPSSSRSSAPPR